MIGSLLENLRGSNDLVAISIDVRNMPDQEKVLEQQLAALPENTQLTSFFLNASDKVLLKRYSETRRLHPCPRAKSHYRTPSSSKASCWNLCRNWWITT